MTVGTFNPKTQATAIKIQQQPYMKSGKLIVIPLCQKVYIVTQGCQMNEYDSQKDGRCFG